MKYILIDLGGVLLKNKPIAILDKLNISDTEHKELEKFFTNWEKLDLGEQTLEEKFNECNYSDEIKEKYKNILIHWYEIRDINMNIIELINKLKRNNYLVFIFTDNSKESINYYQSHPLFNNIDGWVASCDYQALKEDGKLFEYMLDKYVLNPSECYLIDDKEINISMANNYGIKGYQFDENSDIVNLYNNMKENGISID